MLAFDKINKKMIQLSRSIILSIGDWFYGRNTYLQVSLEIES